MKYWLGAMFSHAMNVSLLQCMFCLMMTMLVIDINVKVHLSAIITDMFQRLWNVIMIKGRHIT